MLSFFFLSTNGVPTGLLRSGTSLIWIEARLFRSHHSAKQSWKGESRWSLQLSDAGVSFALFLQLR